MVDLKKLIQNGVQFGHQTWRWSPLMAPYIWGEKNGVHLIDVSKTALQLDRAARFLEGVAAEGKQILWVGTKKSAQNAVHAAAESLKCPYVVNRWIGGTLSNFSQVKKSVTKLLHFEDVIDKAEKYSYTKKEFGMFQKLVNRLEKNVGGIKSLTWPVGAVVVIDAKKESTAVREAFTMGIPVVALVDTIGWPRDVVVDYLIPGNDDAARAVSVIVAELSDAIARGRELARARKAEKTAAEEAAALEASAEIGEAGILLDEGEEAEAGKKRGAQRRTAKIVAPGEEVDGEVSHKKGERKPAPAASRSSSALRRRLPAQKKGDAKKSTEKKADRAS
ncbi:MAG: 30S ribosomal protein S2 [Candidatus Babeliaceae bacterium]|nr:30S ribosomal protein S2 [Candidatus Babeliaceae bacterium]